MDYHNHPKVMAWLYRLCFFTNNNKNNSNNNDDDNDNYNNNPHAQSLLSHKWQINHLRVPESKL